MPIRALSILAALIASASSIGVAHAQAIQSPGRFGVGVGTGTYSSGLSLKYFATPSIAFQGTAGVYRSWRGAWYDCDDRGRRCGRNDALALGLDLLNERAALAGNSDISLNWSTGAGAALAIDDDLDFFSVAVAFVIGLELNLHIIPLDFVVEYRPNLQIIEEVDFDLVQFSGHVRYYF